MWFAVLGPLLVHDGESPVDVPSGRQRVLLAVLLLHAGNPVSADALAEAIWDGAPPSRAAVTLRSHVLRLRRVLGPRAGARLVTRYPGYLLRADEDEVDLLRFRRLCRDGGAAVRERAWARADELLGQALGLWRGAPLADISSESLCRDEVPDLEALRLQAEEWLIDAGLHRGRHDELIPELRALAARHPLRERFHAQLMIALSRCGRQAEALAAYQHAREMLTGELGTEPGPELRELHRQILSGDSGTDVSSAMASAVGVGDGEYAVASSRRLVGRGSERAMLSGLVKRVAEGRGGAVLIEGEPGIGKSALVQAAMAEAASLGCQVFWGAGDELGQALPLQPLLEGLRVHGPSANPRRTMIVRLLRGEVAADRGTDVPAMLAEQLLALIAEHCALRPTIVVVDDLQWADNATLTVWTRLARSSPHAPLLMVGMMRPVPQRDDLLALRRSAGDPARLQLGGLTDAMVAELIAALTDGKPDAGLLRLAAGAAGNPLYITELVAALKRSSRLAITGTGVATLTAGSVPDSLPAAIADRLGFVSEPVRKALRAAALLGVDFTVTDLAIVLERKVGDLVWVLDEACAAGVLAQAGKRLKFRHPLIRSALYEEMPAPVRAAWHRETGRALAEAGAPADRVARQLLWATGGPDGSPDPADKWILDWLASAADRLVGQAPRVAAELLARAVVSSAAGTAEHGWLASRLADALYRIGETAQAEQVASRALEHAVKPGLLVDLHWTLAQCRGLSGLFAESLATLDQALATPGISDRHRARLLVLEARMYGSQGELDKAGHVVADALTAASEAGDSGEMGWALLIMAHLAHMRGKMTDALPLYDRALAITEADPALTDLRLLIQINKATGLGNLDRYEEALAAADQARQLADQVGTAVRLAQAHGALAQMLYETGRWDDALAEIDIVSESLKEPGLACCDFGIAAVISFHRGDAEAARCHLAAAVPHANRLGHRLIGPLALARSLDREHAGALPEALAALTAEFVADTEELLEVENLLADAVRLAIETGDKKTAQIFTGHAATLAAESEIPHRQANALYCQGLLDHDPIRLLAAAERYQHATRPLLSAKALEAAAGEFLLADDLGQARAACTRAVDLYTSLGAAADIVRLQATSRAL